MDEINPHYAQFVEEWFDGRGYCVRYDVGYAYGSIVCGSGNGLKVFDRWTEAYDAAVQMFSEPGHPAGEPAI